MCCNEQLPKKKTEQIWNIFHDTSGYRKAVIQRFFFSNVKKTSAPSANVTHSHQDDVSQSYLITLSYKRVKHSATLSKKWTGYFAINTKKKLIYTGRKLGSNFNIRNITKKEHKHDLVCNLKCPEEACNETYTGETGRKLVERTDKHR